MARGWESKDVESQIEEREAARAAKQKQRSPEEVERERKRESLLLTRTRLLAELQAAANPRYRTLKEQALAHIDAQLAELASGGAEN